MEKKMGTSERYGRAMTRVHMELKRLKFTVSDDHQE